jgi:hypothetical protein
MECSVTADEIRYGLFPSDDNGTFSGPVPDGVASVTLSFAAAAGRHARSARGRRARAATLYRARAAGQTSLP